MQDNQNTVEAVEVTQADRNAAVRLMEAGGQDWQAKEIRIGVGDHFPLVQALAQHRIAAMRAAEPAGEDCDKEEEAFEIGKRDGYSDAIQWIDCRTGGDGIYFASTFPGEGCPGPVEMRERIVERFNALQAPTDQSALVAELVVALHSAIAAIEDDAGLDDAICCSGHDCGCRGSSHRQILLHDLRETITRARQTGGAS